MSCRIDATVAIYLLRTVALANPKMTTGPRPFIEHGDPDRCDLLTIEYPNRMSGFL